METMRDEAAAREQMAYRRVTELEAKQMAAFANQGMGLPPNTTAMQRLAEEIAGLEEVRRMVSVLAERLSGPMPEAQSGGKATYASEPSSHFELLRSFAARINEARFSIADDLSRIQSEL